MKKWKSILAFVLVVAMCLTLLAACAKKEETSVEPESSEPETPNEPSDSETPGEPSDSETPDEPNEDDEPDEIVSIEFWMIDFMDCGDGIEPMAEAMNAITEKEIGVHVNFHTADAGNYDQQLSLAISGGDEVDIALYWPAGASNFSSMLAAGELYDLSAEMHEYAQDTLDMVGDYMGANMVGDAIYGIPAYRNYASSVYIVARTDILEELNAVDTFHNMTTWEEYIDLCKQAMSVEENTYGIAARGANDGSRVLDKMEAGIILKGEGSLNDVYITDTLGDNMKMISAIEGKPVEDIYETSVYTDAMKIMAEWYNEGILFPDSMATTESNDDQMKQGVVFSMLSTSEYGVEATKESATGFDLEVLELAAGQINTGMVSKFGLLFTVNNREPEATAKFINLFYTNREMNNLFYLGIEGQDYTVTDGIATVTDDRKWTAMDFTCGNQFLMYPVLGNPADQREICREILNNSEVSPYMGFAFDTSELTNTVAALTSVYNEYVPALSGGGYTDAMYDEFITKLKAAGIDDYVAAAQQQLDDWLQK